MRFGAEAIDGDFAMCNCPPGGQLHIVKSITSDNVRNMLFQSLRRRKVSQAASSHIENGAL